MQEKKKSKLNKAWENGRKRENIKTDVKKREKIMKRKKCWNTANKEKEKWPSKGAKMIKTERDNEKKMRKKMKKNEKRIKMKE